MRYNRIFIPHSPKNNTTANISVMSRIRFLEENDLDFADFSYKYRSLEELDRYVFSNMLTVNGMSKFNNYGNTDVLPGVYISMTGYRYFCPKFEINEKENTAIFRLERQKT